MFVDERARLRLGLGFLAFLILLSIYLGVERIFQVDEVQYAFQARLLGTGKAMQYSLNAPVFLLGPLSWLAGSAKTGVAVLVRLRLPFVGLMWVNALLLVKGAGFRLRSRAGLVALLLASTLAPMWDYGFELRHDVVLLTGILGIWCLGRDERLSLPIRLFLGAFVAAFLQFVAFKAFAYSLPVLAIMAYRGRPWTFKAWLRWLPAMAGGVALGLLFGRLLHGLAGTWPLFWNSQAPAAGGVIHVTRFSPWLTLKRLADETPLLAWGALAAWLLPLAAFRDRKVSEFLDQPGMAEWLYATASLAALLVNPTPFPYNLIHVVPPLFLLLMARREAFLEGLATMQPQGRLALATALVLLQLGPWSLATARHLDMDNTRQCEVIVLAEAMTDPARHRVFDGSGLVATRDPVGVNWLLHTLTVANFSNGVWPSLRGTLAVAPTPVLLPNYRLEWLPQEDKDFINAHYLSLASDFMVLGGIWDPGPGRWSALVEGRYQVMLLKQKGAGGPAGLSLDGAPVAEGVRVLQKGEHTFVVPQGTRLVIAWLGPTLETLPPMGGVTRPLFVNWY